MDNQKIVSDWHRDPADTLYYQEIVSLLQFGEGIFNT